MHTYIVYLAIFLLCFLSTLKSENLTLQEAEEIAIANNKQVQATRELLEKAKQGKLESYSKWLPQLYAMTESNISQKKQLPFVNAKTGFMTQLILTQSLFSSDVYYGIKIAELYVKQLKLLLEAAINDALFDIRTTYFQVVLDKKNIETAKVNIELFTALAKKMQDNYRADLAILYDVNQSKVILANTLTSYYQAVKRYRIDVDVLSEVLGFEPGTKDYELVNLEFPLRSIPELATKLDIVNPIFAGGIINFAPMYTEAFPCSQITYMQKLFTSDEMYYWEQMTQQYRPSVRLAENYLSIANERLRNKVGEYFPRADLRGSYGGEPAEYLFNPSKTFSDQHFQWGVQVSLSWTIFDSFGRERRVKQARYDRNAYVFQYQNSVIEAFADLRKQIFTIEESLASYLSSKGNVNLAEETLLLAKERLEIGYITIYDYQISVDGLVKARYNLDQAEYEILAAYYGLRHASGIDVRSYFKGAL